MEAAIGLLQICQDVASDAPVAVPTSIIGNTDTNAKLLLACAQRAGEALARYKSGGWVAMIRENLISTVALATTGTLVSGSAVVTGIPSTAALSPTVFAASGANIPANTAIASVDGSSQVTLSQAATGAATGEAITFSQFAYALPADFQRILTGTEWDRLRRWPLSGPQSPQQWQYWKSGVIGTAFFSRRWRIKELTVAGVIGNYFCLDPSPTENGAILAWEYASNAWCQSASLTAQKRWAADTDTGILDEWLLTLGTRWRFFNRLGFAYAEELDEYERETAKAFANDGGMPILMLADPVIEYPAPGDLATTGLVTIP